MASPTYVISDSKTPCFLEKFDKKTDNLAISFSSSPDSFDWFNSLENFSLKIPFNRLYLADMTGTWWHGVYKGIEGFGPLALVNFLKKKIEQNEAKKILVIGSSRGGYGAILFGCLLNVDKVLAFSPQTSITKGLDTKYQIYSKIENLKKTIHGYTLNNEFLDLKKVLEVYGNNKTQYKIFYGSANKADDDHAKRISNFNGVQFITTETDSHKTSRIFLANGTVEKEIEEIFNVC